MGWNRERLAFVLSVLVLLGSILHATGSFLGGDATSISLQEPAPAQRGIVGGSVTIDWFEGAGGAIRDPYQAKSDWRSARPDSLALPPYDVLERRIPLPAPVASAPRAWPGLEQEPPEQEGGSE